MKETNAPMTETPYFSKVGETYDGYVVGEDYFDLGKIESIEVQKWLGEPQVIIVVNGEQIYL